MSAGESKQAPNVETVKSELRQAVRQLSELTRSDATFDEFCQQVLSRLVQLTGAHGALLWQMAESGGPRITHKTGTPGLNLDIDDRLHRDVVSGVINKQSAVAMGSETLREPDRDVDAEAIQCLLLLAPVFNRQNNCCGSLELLQRKDISSSAKEGYLKFLCRIAELFQRWHEHHDLSKLSLDAEQRATTMEFVTEVHRSIDLDEAAFTIANESRRLLNCDRVSFAKWNGSACRVLAVSSQDRFDNRSNVIRLLGRLATASVSVNLPLWICGDTEGLPPEIIRRLNDYLDESHCRTIAVLPLLRAQEQDTQLEFNRNTRRPPEKLGALIVEYFDTDVNQQDVAEQVELIRNHAQLAVGNAEEHSRIFLRPLWRRLGDLQTLLFRNHFAKTMTALAVLGLMVALLIMYPAEMKMRVNGVMQPSQRRNIFARTEGVVKNILVDQGDVVASGDLLVQLENPDLEIRMEETRGQLNVVNQKLKEIKSRLSRIVGRQQEEEQSIALWGQVDQLEEQATHLATRMELMQLKKEMQSIASPIDGTVVTWDARQRLSDLPVSSNQLVLSIADFKGDWEAELRIPQNQVGYVAAAMDDSRDQDLDVEFRVATHPNLLIHGKLVRLADRSDPGRSGIPEFRAIVNADVSQLKDLRPGAGLTAKIYCGRRPLGFVWFYQIIDFLRTRVFF